MQRAGKSARGISVEDTGTERKNSRNWIRKRKNNTSADMHIFGSIKVAKKRKRLEF